MLRSVGWLVVLFLAFLFVCFIVLFVCFLLLLFLFVCLFVCLFLCYCFSFDAISCDAFDFQFRIFVCLLGMCVRVCVCACVCDCMIA